MGLDTAVLHERVECVHERPASRTAVNGLAASRNAVFS